jgi:uncharacterized protein YjdB
MDTISYSVTNSCGTAVATKVVTITPSTAVAAITGPSSVCQGSTITLSDATPGGTWTSGATSVASIGSSTGIVSGISGGTTVITYALPGGCGTPATYTVTVNPLPSGGTISGPASLCIGNTALLTGSIPGGAWTSSNTLVATIDAGGNVTGIAAGTSVISYAVSNTCGTATITQTETVNPLPTVAAITGTLHECVGATTTLSSATTGGIWSSGNPAVAVIGSSSGVATGISAGTATISYTYTSPFGCSATVTAIDTVLTAPVVAAISGTTHQCVGSTTTFTDATPGGVWSSSNTAIASISTSGIASGISAGVATISYSVSAGGCTSAATIDDTVMTVPAHAPITGTMTVCAGATTTLSNTDPGGVWSSSAPGIATVNAGTGVVTGISAGTAHVYYTIATICGSAADTATVTVNAAPFAGIISAPFTNLCIGATVALLDPVTGGAWSSSNTSVAAVGSTGVVTGLSAGTATISYTVSSGGCTGMSTQTLTVGGTPPSAVITPAGSVTLCHGAPVTLSISATTTVTYQWLYNNAPIPGATNATYSAYTTGYLSAFVSNGSCDATITGVTVIAPPNPVISFTAPNILSTGTFASYQWYLNGIAIPGANSNLITITGTGAYTVVVSDFNGCNDTSFVYMVTGGTGVASIAMENIKVYPNPATSVLNIDAPMNVNVTILSMDGKVLKTAKDATSIDVSNLANGLYMAMIYDQNNILIKTTKFAKAE